MPLGFTNVTLKPGSGTPISGYSWPLAALPFDELLGSVYPDDVVVYAQAGRRVISNSPLADRDACSRDNRWDLADVSSDVTRVQSPSVLGGLPRWSTPDSPSTPNGLKSTIPAPLTDYTIASLVRVDSDTGGIQTLFSTVTGSSHFYLAIGGAGQLGCTHGSDNNYGPVVTDKIGQWAVFLATHRESDHQIQYYVDTLASLDEETAAETPPAGTTAGLMLRGDGANVFAGDMALTVVWKRHMVDDTAALGSILTAMGGLRDL
ncbi:MAG: hypothetical protein AcusKO_29240 [Acuticoccus sp.]